VVRTATYDSFRRASEADHLSLATETGQRRRGDSHPHEDRLGVVAAPELQKIVRDLDPTVPIYDVRTLVEHVDKNLFLRKIPARMFVVLGPLLLVLAAIGIYAVVAYAVSHRTAEIGVRLALGATGGRVVRQIVRESLRVVGIGAGAGMAAAFLVAIHVMRGAPINAVVFVGVPLILMAVAALACWVPARRASRVDPVVGVAVLGVTVLGRDWAAEPTPVARVA
jgi:hypothetical protein